VEEALERASVGWDDLSLLSVAHGPGLVGSLLVGVSAAKGYALATGLPLAPVNHLEGHLMSAFLHHAGEPPTARELYPTLGLIASGGHSDLVLMASPGSYETVGCTRDDAAGEALDKAARHLHLGFPGGPALERAAEGGDPGAVAFPRPRLEGFDYSFSGLKTALLRQVEQTPPASLYLADVAASFQQAVVDSLCLQLEAAARHYQVAQIVLGGGVSANRALRRAFQDLAQALGVEAAVPPLEFCTDNAAIIAAAGYALAQRGELPPLDFDVFSVLPLAP
jgi:N6-L-threonylcarbamoyladenine synthase